MWGQARTILWAQWRVLINFYSKGNLGSLVLVSAMSVAWYGLSVAGAVGCAILASSPARIELLSRSGPQVLVFMLVYWQIIPIFLTSTGASLDLRRLAVYPVTRLQLFGLEVMLRVTTGVEMLILLSGCAIGLLLNPAIPKWGPLALAPWIAMNLFLAAGTRSLLGRLLARRRVRELAVFILVLLMAVPQLLILTGVPERWRALVLGLDFAWWPWEVTARLALGRVTVSSVLLLAGWTLAAGWFGWRQFCRSLRFDPEEARASVEVEAASPSWSEWLYRIPSRLLPDPLAAILEKELRILSRAPRFRIVFLMGFSFGLLIWLPLAFREGRTPTSFLATNYLTFVTVYALMLLGEVSFWNTFGFDRSAVQNYYVMPVRISQVLMAKNLASLFFVLLEISAVALVCLAVRMPLSLAKVSEAYSVALAWTLWLLAMGNLWSAYFPRPANPAQSWRSASAGRVQALLMLAYPVCAIPILLAFLARYAFESQAAFYGVLGIGVLIGGIFYWVSMETAVDAAERRKEIIVAALSQGEGPVAV